MIALHFRFTCCLIIVIGFIKSEGDALRSGNRICRFFRQPLLHVACIGDYFFGRSFDNNFHSILSMVEGQAARGRHAPGFVGLALRCKTRFG